MNYETVKVCFRLVMRYRDSFVQLHEIDCSDEIAEELVKENLAEKRMLHQGLNDNDQMIYFLTLKPTNKACNLVADALFNLLNPLAFHKWKQS
jgi:hypothetical protein